MPLSVNSYLPQVNVYLPPLRYIVGMTKERAKPGRKKGDTYTVKDDVAPGLGGRIKLAMQHRQVLNNAVLARMVGCERATIGGYINGERDRPSPVILLKISQQLRISPYWLVLNEGRMLDGILEIGQFEPGKFNQRPRQRLMPTIGETP